MTKKIDVKSELFAGLFYAILNLIKRLEFMKKEKRVWILCILGVLILICLIASVVYFILYQKQEEETPELRFKEVQEVNYGAYDLSDFIVGVVCETECVYHNEKITYSVEEVKELGLQKIKVQVEYLGVSYEKEFAVNVVDKEPPLITLSTSEVTITQGEDFEPNSFVESIKDNYDEVALTDITIENKVNKDVLGDYEVTYSLKDKSENVATKTLIVHVVTKEEETNTDRNDTPASNENQNVETPSNANSTNSTSSSSKPSSSSSSITSTSLLAQALNSVTLSPLKTRNEELDSQIASIVSSTTNSSMSNYDKLRALYDYVKQRLSYSVGIINLDERFALQDEYGYYNYDAHYILNARYALQNNTGSCDNYSALFMLLARRVGFEAYVVNGQYMNTSGNVMGHAWVMIKAGGKYYIFDPQIEDNYGYNYFGINPDTTKSYYYNLNTTISNFHNFSEDPTLIRSYTLTINVTGAITDSEFFKINTQSFNQEIVNVGEKVSIELIFSRSQKYDIKVTSNDKVILEEEFNGDRKVVNYTFDSEGTEDLEIYVENYKMHVSYNLYITVRENPTTTEIS